MRSHLKLSLILAAAVFPIAGHAEVVPTKGDLLLSLTQAKKAFNEFKAVVDKDGKSVTLFGSTSVECMNAFIVANDPAKGEFTIKLPDGSDSACLDYTNVLKKSTPAGLSEKEGAKLVFTASVKKVALRSKDPTVDLAPEPDELWDRDLEGHPIQFTSPADLAKQKIADAEAEKLKLMQSDYLLATSCIHGFDELDLREPAISSIAGYLKAQPAGAVRIDGKKIDAKWVKKMFKETDIRFLDACSKQFRRAKLKPAPVVTEDSEFEYLSDLENDQMEKKDGFARCDQGLPELVKKDPDYFGPKVRRAYLGLVNRYKTDPTLQVNDAYDKADEAIRILRGMDLGQDGLEAVDAAERELLLTLLDRAAREGDAQSYGKMAKKFSASLLDQNAKNDHECLNANATINLSQQFNPACQEINKMAAQLQKSAGDSFQAVKEKEALAIQKQIIEQQQLRMKQAAEQEQLKVTACQTIRATGGTLTPECAAYEAKASAAANQGIVNPNGHAEPIPDVRTPAAVMPSVKAANPVISVDVSR